MAYIKLTHTLPNISLSSTVLRAQNSRFSHGYTNETLIPKDMDESHLSLLSQTGLKE